MSSKSGLFEPYVRANSGDLPAGFGFGLAIARDIVEARADRIGLESHLGAGTWVWFTSRSLKRDVAGSSPTGSAANPLTARLLDTRSRSYGGSHTCTARARKLYARLSSPARRVCLFHLAGG
jgi:hypothetical protein